MHILLKIEKMVDEITTILELHPIAKIPVFSLKQAGLC